MQSHVNKECSEKTIKAKAGSSIGNAVRIAIKRFESETIDGITTETNELSDKQFKSLRRALPIFKHKIDWTNIAHDKVANQLGALGLKKM